MLVPREREVKALTHSALRSMGDFSSLTLRSLYSLKRGVG